jgi:CP family cyanate transporter-like MFS transporter
MLMTALLGLGVALMQPALPVLVARWCPGFLALGSAVYMNGLLMGEFVGGGLTLPWVLPAVDGDWRAALAVWSLPALLVAAVLVACRGIGATRAPASAGAPRPLWNAPWGDARVWRFGIVLGAASAGFFGTNAYLGPVLDARGEGARLADMLFWFNATQVAGSLLMLVAARALSRRRWAAPAIATAVVLGVAGVGFGGSIVFLPAVVLLGLGTCMQLILMVSLVPQLVGEREAGPLAAGMFAVGYLLGFAVPLAGGVVADLTGTPQAALLPIGVLAVLALAVALGAGFGQGVRLSTSGGTRCWPRSSGASASPFPPTWLTWRASRHLPQSCRSASSVWTSW